jgi:hypothetical protein
MRQLNSKKLGSDGHVLRVSILQATETSCLSNKGQVSITNLNKAWAMP